MPNYTKLESVEDLDAAFRTADEATVVVFKHSLTCPVSTEALREFDRYLESGDEATRYYLIEIQRQRGLSNDVAARTGVRHESPQALVLRGGEVVWHASHWKITKASLADALAA
ncbi:MAG: bacillithiol system redox-active protein YtxJ [Acidobacteriota bacterium]